MNDARPPEELDIEALARGDRVALAALIDRCRLDREFVFAPDVLVALRSFRRTRALQNEWKFLLAELKSCGIDVPSLKRKLREVEEAEPEPDDSNAGDSQAARLLAIAEPHEYFRDQFGEPYVSYELPLPEGGSRLDTIMVRSRKARLLLVHEYVSAFTKPPTAAAISGVLEALEARAIYSSVVHPVCVRRYRCADVVYLDRGTADGSAYMADRDGWRIIPRPPPIFRFLRPADMEPLAEAVPVDPKEGILKLREVTRFRTDRDEIITVSFTLDAIGGEGPFAVLEITGEGGSAKSSLALVIRRLVDPRSGKLLAAPHSAQEVFIHASTRALVPYNNVSHLEPAISDAICIASEGGSNNRRSLFTNKDEATTYGKAPFILTSIDKVVLRRDLASRRLRVELAAVPSNEILTEPEFLQKVEQTAPTILGALLSAVSEGLRRYADVRQQDYPRLATFAHFVSACEAAFWPAGTFAQAFAESAAAAADEVLAADPVAEVLRDFLETLPEPRLESEPKWKGTATQLLAELEAIVRAPERAAGEALALAKTAARSDVPHKYRTDEEKEKDREVAKRIAGAEADLKAAREGARKIMDERWPKAGNALSARLKKIGPQLRVAGISIEWPTRHGDGKVLKFFSTIVNKAREGSSRSSDRPDRSGRNEDEFSVDNCLDKIPDVRNEEKAGLEGRPGIVPGDDPDYLAPGVGE